jgi:hypothetical protein
MTAPRDIADAAIAAISPSSAASPVAAAMPVAATKAARRSAFDFPDDLIFLEFDMALSQFRCGVKLSMTNVYFETLAPLVNRCKDLRAGGRII